MNKQQFLALSEYEKKRFCLANDIEVPSQYRNWEYVNLKYVSIFDGLDDLPSKYRWYHPIQNILFALFLLFALPIAKIIDFLTKR